MNQEIMAIFPRRLEDYVSGEYGDMYQEIRRSCTRKLWRYFLGDKEIMSQDIMKICPRRLGDYASGEYGDMYQEIRR